MSVKNEFGDEVTVIAQKLESFSTNSNDSPLENRSRSTMSMSPMSPMDHHSEEKLKADVSNEKKKYLLETKMLIINVPEKILFIIDATQESKITPFELESGKKLLPLPLIRKAVEMFVHTKSTISRSHEYAVMSLNGDVPKWICSFTNNIKQVINSLGSVMQTQTLDEDQNICDLSACFKMVMDNLELEEYLTIPKFVNRVILIYGRSQTVTSISDSTYFDLLVRHPYVFLDALYVHESPTEDNESEKVYGELQRLDTKNNSFILEVGRKAAELFSSMAMLVAHSLQRPNQNATNYTITLSDNSTDV
ncbi:BRISC and BRCA1-A complex member 1-like [Cotesia glomerata]|uniref:BRISC and BRCA1-A complex member 1 n=1 Tax=Cotesia glomerata TaxID=32391 RepID=A0AAV7J4H3_COTGL|nr:BRISC and BRCA1-A complex member 1-like [Cotesia glomerata]KAH0567615.1 hypothetical protein KQX54_011062 [Cotesia glomerata]